MAIVRSFKNKNYTTMCNHHLNDNELSLKAKGLLSFMLSKPDTWDFSINGLKSQLKEGRDGIRSALTELEQNGYLKRVRQRDDNGKLRKVEYHIFEINTTEKPTSDLPKSEKPTSVNPIQVNTKLSKDYSKVNTEIKNNSMLVVSEETPTNPFDKFSNEVKVLFKEVNPLFLKRYRPKTQVQFVKQLKVIEKCLTMYSANDLIGLIKYAVNDETFWKRSLQSLNGLINKNKDGVLKIDSIYPNYAQEKSSAKKEFKNKITIKRGK